jgi:uncharacterized protein
MESTITYFDEPGKENTLAVLALVKSRALTSGITRVVIASTTGETARAATQFFADSGISLVVIPHQRGFRDEERFDMQVAAELQQAGHRVHWSTMLFHTNDFYGTTGPTALANLLRIFGQGTKVCVEILLMATDGGMVDRGEKVLVVAGSGRGADTALLATASTSNRIKEVKIHEILCKPLL